MISGKETVKPSSIYPRVATIKLDHDKVNPQKYTTEPPESPIIMCPGRIKMRIPQPEKSSPNIKCNTIGGTDGSTPG